MTGKQVIPMPDKPIEAMTDGELSDAIAVEVMGLSRVGDLWTSPVPTSRVHPVARYRPTALIRLAMEAIEAARHRGIRPELTGYSDDWYVSTESGVSSGKRVNRQQVAFADLPRAICECLLQAVRAQQERKG